MTPSLSTCGLERNDGRTVTYVRLDRTMINTARLQTPFQSIQRACPTLDSKSEYLHFGNVWRTFVRLGRTTSTSPRSIVVDFRDTSWMLWPSYTSLVHIRCPITRPGGNALSHGPVTHAALCSPNRDFSNTEQKVGRAFS